MSFVCGTEEPCIAAWSPAGALPQHLATGSYDSVYGSGNQASSLDLNAVLYDGLEKVSFKYRSVIRAIL